MRLRLLFVVKTMKNTKHVFENDIDQKHRVTIVNVITCLSMLSNFRPLSNSQAIKKINQSTEKTRKILIKSKWLINELTLNNYIT